MIMEVRPRSPSEKVSLNLEIMYERYNLGRLDVHSLITYRPDLEFNYKRTNLKEKCRCCGKNLPTTVPKIYYTSQHVIMYICMDCYEHLTEYMALYAKGQALKRKEFINGYKHYINKNYKNELTVEEL